MSNKQIIPFLTALFYKRLEYGSFETTRNLTANIACTLLSITSDNDLSNQNSRMLLKKKTRQKLLTKYAVGLLLYEGRTSRKDDCKRTKLVLHVAELLKKMAQLT